MKRASVFVWIGLATIASACSGARTSDDPAGNGLTPSQPLVEMSDAQQAALVDRDVTESEYREGFRRFAACLKAEGFVVIERGDRNRLIEYGVPEDAVASGSDERCYASEFASLDEAWQLKNIDTSDTAVHLRACLDTFELPPEESVDAMLAALKDAGISPIDCG